MGEGPGPSPTQQGQDLTRMTVTLHLSPPSGQQGVRSDGAHRVSGPTSSLGGHHLPERSTNPLALSSP